MLAAAALIAGAGGMLIAQTTPALADPNEFLVAVGSDTIQDIYNSFSVALGGNTLASYNAVDPVSGVAGQPITPSEVSQNGTNADSATSGFTQCSFNRPNGSSAGVEALRTALNPTSALGYGASTPGSTTNSPQPFCVDIARSSSKPSSLSTSGPIVAIPFAEDAVAAATGPLGTDPNFSNATFTYDFQEYTNPAVASSVVVTPQPTMITHADAFTLVDLENLYSGCAPVTEGGVTYWPFGSPVTEPTGAQVIDLYVPQAGSGTRNFWASTLNFNNTSLPPCVHDQLVNDATAGLAGNTIPATGIPVEEHNGTSVAADPEGLMPFSAAQWIAQRNGIDDRRHEAVIHNLTPDSNVTQTQSGTYVVNGTTFDLFTYSGTNGALTSPFTGTVGTPAISTPGSLNSAFPINRSVYSVVSYARVTNPADPLYGLLNNASGENFVCSDITDILSHGFAQLNTPTNTNTTDTDTCGSVLSTLRASG